MRNSFSVAILLSMAGILTAQQPASTSSLKVSLPPGSPVALLDSDWGQSTTSQRGGATVLNLNSSLTLRNTSPNRIRAVTWMVFSQEVTPGGRASVTKSNLSVGPGESFPVRVELRLLRPMGRPAGPLVEISLDGVLFDDLSFFGPNKLDSRRMMTVEEMEAQRDRRWFKQVLEARGEEALKQECIASLAKQRDMPGLDIQVARAPATNTAARTVQLSVLQFPDAPVEAFNGSAQIAGAEARQPMLQVMNRSQQSVRYMELGWILKDLRGREYLAGSVPSATKLAPKQKASVLAGSALKFSEPDGAPLSIESITSFVSQVEFANGTVWIPGRTSGSKALAASAEEMRLTNIYTRKGLKALVEELKKF